MTYRGPLKNWEYACMELRSARSERNPAWEARAERRVADLERGIINMLYKQEFGHRIGYPRFARSYAKRKA